MERSHRLSQFDGQQPDRPSAKHCRGLDGDRKRQSLQENYGECEWRNSAAERNHQHHGGPAERVRRRSHTRGPRSGNGREAWRAGASAGCCWYMERPDRLSELDGWKPDSTSAKYRRSHHRSGARRFVPQNHRGRKGRNSRAEEHDQYDGGPIERVRR